MAMSTRCASSDQLRKPSSLRTYADAARPAVPSRAEEGPQSLQRNFMQCTYTADQDQAVLYVLLCIYMVLKRVDYSPQLLSVLTAPRTTASPSPGIDSRGEMVLKTAKRCIESWVQFIH